jgi:hypothetical protein
MKGMNFKNKMVFVNIHWINSMDDGVFHIVECFGGFKWTWISISLNKCEKNSFWV